MGDEEGRPKVGKEEEALVSETQENNALVRRFLEAQAKRELDTVKAIMAP